MSEAPTIRCPNCGHEFALNEAFIKQFEKEKQTAISQALEAARQDAQAELEEQRSELLRHAQQEAEEYLQLKLEEKDEELRRIGKQLRDLERRTQQGSMELQGEALESYLKASLEYAFPSDSISDVTKGHRSRKMLIVSMRQSK